MIKVSIFNLIYSLLVSVACQRQFNEKISNVHQTSIADTIKHLVGVFEESVNNLDLNSQFSIFTNDPDFTFAEDGKIYPPKDSIRVFFQPRYGSLR